ncbi:MAG: hypothetical protein HOC74_04845 [Gemmatimonadetes bacterium]|jgi:hypothetical protein|nr:hypothetical protein [Gemmatimonadota bacterium]
MQIGTLAMLAVGCAVSEHNWNETSENVPRGNLQGRWCSTGNSSSWYLSGGEMGAYTLTHSEGAEYSYPVHQFRIADHDFVDIGVAIPTVSQTYHVLARIRTTGDSLGVGFLDPNWVWMAAPELGAKTLSEGVPFSIPPGLVDVAGHLVGTGDAWQTILDHSVMLSAPTGRLREFLSTIADSSASFPIVMTLTKCAE